MNELEIELNETILRNKHITVNKNIFCPDGQYNNFIIEFNGTNIHLDERFHTNESKNPYGISYRDKHDRDQFKIDNYLLKYNVITIWEYDYNNDKELIKKITNIIKNEIIKKGKYWDSKSI